MIYYIRSALQWGPHFSSEVLIYLRQEDGVAP
jgi:hypothetical protein